MVLNEIASVTILVPYQKGNETINQIIPLKIYHDQQGYKAIPLISDEEKKIAGLPSVISFELAGNQIIPDKMNEADMEVIRNIVTELKMLSLT